MEIKFKVTGLKEAMEQLSVLASPKVQKNLLQNSLVEAMKPAKIKAKANLGKGSGYIVTKKQKATGSGTVASRGIGVAAKHWAVYFQEYGTVERFTKKGARRGKIIAKPFIRPAVDSSVAESVDKINSYLSVETDRIIDGKQKAVTLLRDMDEVK